jgi:hypothetical protein
MNTLRLLTAALALTSGVIVPSQAAGTARYAELVLADRPAAYWRLNDPEGDTVRNLAPGPHAAALHGRVAGKVALRQRAQSPEQFPEFEPDSVAAEFTGQDSFIRVKDPGANSPLDFQKGDSITLEAWVFLNSIPNGGHAYLIGKGRTGTSGLENQNYALRLTGSKGEGKINFLFRSAPGEPVPGTGADRHWHRWTAEAGIVPGSGWHHVAVTYTFGKGASLRAYLDGEPVKGAWDMGGQTDAAPVVDDDELWIGSSMNGKAGLNGLLNEVAIHRRALSPQDISRRFKFVPTGPAVASKDLPAEAVLVEIFEDIGANNSWNFTASRRTDSYTETAFGFAELAQKYTDKGVRADRSAPFLVRASARVKLPRGEHRLLLRALQAARVFVDGKLMATTPFIQGSGDGHSEVPPVPADLPEGLRFARMGHEEAWFNLRSTGREHLVVLEAVIGARNLRPEVGEISLTWRRPDGRFFLLAPKEIIPHTDEGWQAHVDAQRARLAARNAQLRQSVAAAENLYWSMRHEYARRAVARMAAVPVPEVSPALPVHNAIDRFIGARLEAAGVKPAPLTDDFAFLRRVALDTVGVPPTPEQVRAFLNDRRSDRRARAIDHFLAQPGWADHWVGYWQDVLAENPGILKPTLNNTGPFRWWIHESLLDNKPMDRFATELVMMEGSVYGGGPAGFGLATQNDVPMADRAQVLSSAFLAMNLACARCHDAPYHDFKQQDLFSLAAALKRAPEEVPASSSIPPNANITVGRLVNVTLKPGEKVQPAWPFAKVMNDSLPEGVLRNPLDHREQLAAYVTDPRNTRFARVLVNRVWKRYLGWGLVEPVDDWETARPSHPELLEWLAREFMTHGYDLKHLARLILNSHTYQREAGLHTPASDDPKDRLFASPLRRRLEAEQLVDSLFAVAGKRFDTEPLTLDHDGRRAAKDFLNLGQPVRAWEFTGFANDRDRPALSMPRAQAIVDLMGLFGWRDARQSPLSARDHSANVLQPAQLANGDAANGRVARLCDGHAVTALALQDQPLEELVENLFLRALSRPPTETERAAFARHLEAGYATRVRPAPPASLKKEYDRQLQLSWSNHLNPTATEIKMAAEEKARRGDEPTPRLAPDWRERLEDALWALLNSPEFVFVP